VTTTRLPALSEAQWQQRVADLADVRGWLWMHLRPARTTQGWRTPISGPLGAGWPDLLLCRGPRLVALELKSARGRVTPQQEAVLAALAAAGVETHVARPSEWDTVQEVLA
jgi:hypothetical protein